MFRLFITGFLLLLLRAHAHQIDELTVRLSVEDGRITAAFEMDAAYMLPRYRGDAETAPQDLAWLRTRDWETWEEIRAETGNFLNSTLEIISDGEEIPFVLNFPDFETSPPRFMTLGEPDDLPLLTVIAEAPFSGSQLEFDWEEPFGVVLIVQSGDRVIPIVSGLRESVLQRTTLSLWIRLGFAHILPRGLDHIFFILGIFLLQPRWRPLLMQSLLFTLAHSITLGLAIIGWIDLSERWVEVGIAASIVWIAVENLGRTVKEPGRGRYLLVTVFGLVHGLGFARMLGDLLPSDQAAALFGALAGFNLGVEAGQITVLAAAFALFAWWPPAAFAVVRTIGSSLIALGGLVWMLERIFDLEIVTWL